MPCEELLQAQLLDQFQSQPRAAEIAAVLDAHSLDIDLHPLRPHLVEESLLMGALLAFGRLLDALAPGLVELPQISDDPLARAALGAIRLHQRPVGVPLAVLRAITRANEHARIVFLPVGVPKAKVFTTTPWAELASRPAREPKRLASRIPTSVWGSNMTRFPRNHPTLAKLG